MNPSYNDMLTFLQGLLANRQNMQGQQWQQGLGFGQQELAQQNTQFGQTLAEQTAARLAAQNLAEEQQRQAEQAQRFAQGEEVRQTSFPFMSLATMLNNAYSPQGRTTTSDFITALLNRTSPGWNPTRYFTPASGTTPRVGGAGF